MPSVQQSSTAHTKNVLAHKLSNIVKVKQITAEDARLLLIDMEIGVTGLENDLDYFLLLDKANSFVSSLISRKLTNNILNCKRVELSNGS